MYKRAWREEELKRVREYFEMIRRPKKFMATRLFVEEDYDTIAPVLIIDGKDEKTAQKVLVMAADHILDVCRDDGAPDTSVLVVFNPPEKLYPVGDDELPPNDRLDTQFVFKHNAPVLTPGGVFS